MDPVKAFDQNYCVSNVDKDSFSQKKFLLENGYEEKPIEEIDKDLLEDTTVTKVFVYVAKMETGWTRLLNRVFKQDYYVAIEYVDNQSNTKKIFVSGRARAHYNNTPRITKFANYLFGTKLAQDPTKISKIDVKDDVTERVKNLTEQIMTVCENLNDTNTLTGGELKKIIKSRMVTQLPEIAIAHKVAESSDVAVGEEKETFIHQIDEKKSVLSTIYTALSTMFNKFKNGEKTSTEKAMTETGTMTSNMQAYALACRGFMAQMEVELIRLPVPPGLFGDVENGKEAEKNGDKLCKEPLGNTSMSLLEKAVAIKIMFANMPQDYKKNFALSLEDKNSLRQADDKMEIIGNHVRNLPPTERWIFGEATRMLVAVARTNSLSGGNSNVSFEKKAELLGEQASFLGALLIGDDSGDKELISEITTFMIIKQEKRPC